MDVSELSLAPWPQLASPCWPGPKLIWSNGKMRPTRRALLAYIADMDELHDSWLVKRRPDYPCRDPACQNPHHVRVDYIWRTQGTGTPPAPIPPIFTEPTPDDPIEDLIDLIASRDPRPASLDQLDPAWIEAYGRLACQEAIERARFV